MQASFLEGVNKQWRGARDERRFKNDGTHHFKPFSIGCRLAVFLKKGGVRRECHTILILIWGSSRRKIHWQYPSSASDLAAAAAAVAVVVVAVADGRTR